MVISCDITDFQNNQITASTGILYEHKVLELALQTLQGRKGDMKQKAGSVTQLQKSAKYYMPSYSYSINNNKKIVII